MRLGRITLGYLSSSRGTRTQETHGTQYNVSENVNNIHGTTKGGWGPGQEAIDPASFLCPDSMGPLLLGGRPPSLDE